MTHNCLLKKSQKKNNFLRLNDNRDKYVHNNKNKLFLIYSCVTVTLYNKFVKVFTCSRSTVELSLFEKSRINNNIAMTAAKRPQPENKPSSILSLEENDQLFKLIGSRCKVSQSRTSL